MKRRDVEAVGCTSPALQIEAVLLSAAELNARLPPLPTKLSGYCDSTPALFSSSWIS